MGQRFFVQDKIEHEGRWLRGFRIQCSACKQIHKVPMNTTQTFGNGNDDLQIARHVQRKFENLDWRIGKRDNGADDYCPNCRADKPSPSQSDKPTLHIVADNRPPMEQKPLTEIKNELRTTAASIEPPAPPPPAPSPPRPHVPPPPLNQQSAAAIKLTREDRRIIFAKLEEVYENETVGYAEGWSDDRVARDLGIAKVAIAQVRLENFGEWADNPTLRNLITETRDAIEESKTISARVQSEFNTLEQEFQRLKGSLAESQRAAQRVLNIEARLRAVQNK